MGHLAAAAEEKPGTPIPAGPSQGGLQPLVDAQGRALPGGEELARLDVRLHQGGPHHWPPGTPPPLTQAAGQPSQPRAPQSGRQPHRLGYGQATSTARLVGPGHGVHAHGAVGRQTHEHQPDRRPAPARERPPTMPARGRRHPALPIRECLLDPRQQVHQLLRSCPHGGRAPGPLPQAPDLPSLPSLGATQARLPSACNACTPRDAPDGNPPACPTSTRERQA